MTHSTDSIASQTATFGIILFTYNYQASCEFYRDTIGLPVWYEKNSLTCFQFGDGYLMVETDGPDCTGESRSLFQNLTMLRFNVPDVAVAANALRSKGIDVEVVEHEWGTTGSFRDPDGNWCSLKNADDPYFKT